MDNFINAHQVARILNIHTESVRRLVRQGRIRAEKFCGVLYFDVDYIEQYANSYNPLPGNSPSTRKMKRARRAKKEGYVYILLAENGLRKIGQTGDPRARLDKNAFSMSPIGIKIEKVYKVEDRRISEKKLHQLFYAKRVRGEWFALDDSDVMLVGKMLEEIQFTVRQSKNNNGAQLSLIDFLS